MQNSSLHHISIMTSDLERASSFYRDTLGLTPIPRPNFSMAGAWFELGQGQVHLVLNPQGTFRQRRRVDLADVHFAVRVADFEAAVANLEAKGYSDQHTEDDPRRLVILRAGPAGFPQVYFVDPDGNTVEINAEH